MTHRAVCVALPAMASIAGGAGADLYAVGRADLEVSMYYRVSTTDASATRLSLNPDVEAMAGIAPAPGGAYATMGLGFGSLYTVDPTTGEAAFVANPFGYMFPGGGPAVTPDGVAHISGWKPFDYTRIFRYDLATGEELRTVWLPYEVPPLTALLARPDADLVGAAGRDILEIDHATGDVTTIGTLDASHGQFIYSLAHDPSTGTDYALTGHDLVRRLYQIDLDMLETTLVGVLPEQARISAIAGITCAADFNNDGSLDVLDFVAFQLAWQAGDDAADANADGVLDLLDYPAFQALFQAGCD